MPSSSWLAACCGEAAHTRNEVTSALERVAELIDQMGAESRRPRLEELRAELADRHGDATGSERHLRDAHRLYIEMGATGHAERLARELGPSAESAS